MARTEAPDDRPANGAGLNRRWHLARDDHEVLVAEFEFALMRTLEAFSRWQTECFAAACGETLSGPDNALLHVIRLHDRAKPIKELARLTNRDDYANLQYALRKLAKLGLVEQAGGRSAAVYSVTDRGREATDRYADVRAELLVGFTQAVRGLDEALGESTGTLNLLTGMYEQAARVAATHMRGS